LQLICLELDTPSSVIADRFEKKYPIQRFSIPKKHIVGRDRLAEIVEGALPDEIKDNGKRTLTLYGHNEFHHYTYGLCRALVERRSEHYSYIHIDNHHDEGYGDPYKYAGMIGCGKFVKELSRYAKGGVLSIGSYFSYHNSINPIGMWLWPRWRLNHILPKLAEDVYLSIDLDVMSEEEASTGYNSGSLSKWKLLSIVKMIREQKNIIAADINGFNLEESESVLAKKTLDLYESVAEEMFSLHFG